MAENDEMEVMSVKAPVRLVKAIDEAAAGAAVTRSALVRLVMTEYVRNRRV